VTKKSSILPLLLVLFLIFQLVLGPKLAVGAQAIPLDADSNVSPEAVTATISLEQAVQIVKVPGIYHLSFKDVASVPPGSIGYLALSWGLGIFKGDGWYLNADDKVTRAEAAYTIDNLNGEG